MSELSGTTTDAPPPPPPPPPPNTEVREPAPDAPPELANELSRDGEDTRQSAPDGGGSQDAAMDRALEQAGPVADELRPYLQEDPGEGAAGDGGSVNDAGDAGQQVVGSDGGSPDAAMDRALEQAGPAADELRPYLQEDTGQQDAAQETAVDDRAADPSGDADGTSATGQDLVGPDGGSPDAAMDRALEQAGPAADELRPYLQEDQGEEAAGGGGSVDGAGDAGQQVVGSDSGSPDAAMDRALEQAAPAADELRPYLHEDPADAVGVSSDAGPQSTEADGTPQNAMESAQEQADPVSAELQSYLRDNEVEEGPSDAPPDEAQDSPQAPADDQPLTPDPGGEQEQRQEGADRQAKPDDIGPELTPEPLQADGDAGADPADTADPVTPEPADPEPEIAPDPEPEPLEADAGVAADADPAAESAELVADVAPESPDLVDPEASAAPGPGGPPSDSAGGPPGGPPADLEKREPVGWSFADTVQEAYDAAALDPQTADLVAGADPLGGMTPAEYDAKHWDESLPGRYDRPGNWSYDQPDGVDQDSEEIPKTFVPGEIFDRFGAPGNGVFASPLGTPWAERSLPATSLIGVDGNSPYHAYQVTDKWATDPPPVVVKESKIAPDFEQDGGGVQYRFDAAEGSGEKIDLKWLLDREYIIPVG